MTKRKIATLVFLPNGPAGREVYCSSCHSLGEGKAWILRGQLMPRRCPNKSRQHVLRLEVKK